jgi:hypothetical protein
MARISPQTLSNVFQLLQQLVALVHEAKATEFNLYTNIGENAETIAELDELQNSAERLRASYNRLHALALAISEMQPFASLAMLDLLAESIEVAAATVDSVEASIQEIKRAWDLP